MAILDVDIPPWSIDLIYGNTGSGKSFFAGWLIEQAYERGRRFIVLDTKVKNHIGLVTLPGVKLLKVKVGARYNWKKLIDFDQVLVVPTRGDYQQDWRGRPCGAVL
ncbi:helicase HerA domain-containing protein [Thermococcus sp. JCM 11816]|uniref:helicase HerA domain-containing protein n=1 Tax=Thermococcus sp. (strain JCM 11816 / KS-1) TaxID=1295125 RepID=UPI000A41D2E2